MEGHFNEEEEVENIITQILSFFKMLKNTCCSICLAINKRTINIYKTDLQYAYETLANFKIREEECWMCYICHTRLRQCHQLQQLAVQTRGVIDDIFQKKIDIKFGVYGSLLELSTSRTKTFSTTLPHPKLESDGEAEFCHNNSVPLDENLENTKGTRIISTTPNSSYIEQESDVKMEFCSADDLKQDEIVSNDYEVEEKISIDSEGPLDSSGQLELSNVGNDAQEKSKFLKLKKVKLCVDKYVRQSPITHPDTEICLEDREDSSTRSSWEEQSTENAEIKLEMEDKGTIQDAEQKNTSDCEGENLKKGQLLMPIRSHDPKKPFCCDICKWKFSRKSHLIEHKVIHTGEKPFSCDICSKKFTQKGNLNVHKKNHMGNKPFSCDICSKKFTQKSTLTVHKKNHMGKQKNKPFSCDICSKKFTQKSNLNVHKQIHNSDKAFSCDICSKKFSQKVNLKYHKVIHTGNKSFSCNICSKKFAQSIRLKYHLRIHTGERSFSCDICSKKFLMKSHLNTHIRIHTDEKPFSCDICSMKFSRKCHLQQHELIHTGEKPFSCDICSKNFLRKSHLNSHKRIHWPEKEYIYL